MTKCIENRDLEYWNDSQVIELMNFTNRIHQQESNWFLDYLNFTKICLPQNATLISKTLLERNG